MPALEPRSGESFVILLTYTCRVSLYLVGATIATSLDQTMIIRRTLSTKILMTLLPLFLGAVAVSIYLTYHYQQQHALEQMQAAARTQATIIKESLVQMMVNAQRVDDSYLQRIGQTSDVEQIGIWFYVDSLHLEPDLLSPARLQRLRARELKATAELQPIADRVFLAAEQQWLIQCAVGTHTEGLVHVLSSGRPFVLHSCERLKVILPFTADRRCQECHMVPEGTVLGAAYMEMPLERTVRAIASNAERTLWIFGIFTVIALGIGAVLFRAFVSRPIKRLVRATQIIGKGNLDHPREKLWRKVDRSCCSTPALRQSNRFSHSDQSPGRFLGLCSVWHDFTLLALRTQQRSAENTTQCRAKVVGFISVHEVLPGSPQPSSNR